LTEAGRVTAPSRPLADARGSQQSRTSVGGASLMIGLTPVIVLLIARGIGLEHITGALTTGGAFVLAGVYLTERA